MTGCFLLSVIAIAHPGHDEAEQLDQNSAIEAAANKLEDLIKADKLEPFWLQREVASAQLARVKGRQNWVVSYLDSGSSQRLELIFSFRGNFITFSKRTLSDTATIE